MFAVKVITDKTKFPNAVDKFIVWCDDCWYETSAEPSYTFTEDKAKEIVEKLKNHYVYQSSIVDERGNETKFDCIADIKARQKKEKENISMVDECFGI